MGKNMDASNIALLDKENDIYIEIGAKLNMKFEGSNLSAESIFVGNKAGEYLVITPPSQMASIRDDLSKGSEVSVKYLYQGQILEFQTTLIELIPEPIQLILLECPKVVRQCDLRLQKRINCFISAIIEVETKVDNEEITGVIKDISKSGCRFLIQTSESAENMFKVNEELTLKCHFPGIAGEQEAFGRVQDIQKKDDGIAIGIQFSDTMWWVPPYG